MNRLKGKVALVTGAARGQGRSHAVHLADEGADIIALDICADIESNEYPLATPDDLDETAKLIEKSGQRVISAAVDVRDRAGLKTALDDAVEQLGGLHVVVANAGICIPETWDEVTPTSFRDVMDINVIGVWNTVTATAGRLVERGGGSIILTSSLAGKKMQPFMVHYTTSKHALVGMTRAFAAELGAHNIRVNSIHPGAVATPMGSGQMVARIEETNAANPRLAGMGMTFLNQFVAEADEISNLVAFLASDESTFITAEHISVDGGAQYF